MAVWYLISSSTESGHRSSAGSGHRPSAGSGHRLAKACLSVTFFKLLFLSCQVACC
ncbi:MAG: hypothetical protein OXD32_05970 [Endozoicomonadaceae bacterium]|nr:hypothetical protein [Endozoicomonadaceae bacterium]